MGREDNPIRILAAILRSFREHRELGHSYFIFPSAGQPLASRLSQHSRSRFRGGSFAFISLLPLLLALLRHRRNPLFPDLKTRTAAEHGCYAIRKIYFRVFPFDWKTVIIYVIRFKVAQSSSSSSFNRGEIQPSILETKFFMNSE